MPRWLARAARIYATLVILFLFAYAAGVVLVAVSGQTGGEARQVDFAALWGAGRLALAGDAVAAFDQVALRAAQSLPADAKEGELFWLYPPGMALILAPFGTLPYWAAWLVFGVISISAFWATLSRFAAPVPIGPQMLIAAPIVIISLQLGQLGLLWTAGLCLALRALASGNALAAGLIVGALSLKPQLGLLLPVALIALWRWDVVAWACLGAVLVHGLPTLVTGVEYWAAFLDRIGAISASMEGGGTPHRLMVSPYAFFRFSGAGHLSAYVLQWILTVSIATGVAYLWSRRPGSANLAVGALMVAMPVATPYAYYYEMVLVVAGAVFLLRGGYGARIAQAILLAAALLGPLLLFVWTEAAPLFAPLLLILAGDAALAAARPPSAASNPSPA